MSVQIRAAVIVGIGAVAAALVAGGLGMLSRDANATQELKVDGTAAGPVIQAGGNVTLTDPEAKKRQEYFQMLTVWKAGADGFVSRTQKMIDSFGRAKQTVISIAPSKSKEWPKKSLEVVAKRVPEILAGFGLERAKLASIGVRVTPDWDAVRAGFVERIAAYVDKAEPVASDVIGVYASLENLAIAWRVEQEEAITAEHLARTLQAPGSLSPARPAPPAGGK